MTNEIDTSNAKLAYQKGLEDGIKIGTKIIIEKAYKYLKSLTYQEFAGGPLERLLNEDEINDFIKAMEE